MTYAQAYALAARNAAACEQAKQADCRCACGGRFHGKPHAGAFVAEYAGRLCAIPEQLDQLELLDGEQVVAPGKVPR